MADDAHAPFEPDPGQFSLILHYSPEMVAELAMGAEHPHEIAERYGVDEDAYEHLASQEWFARLVAQKRHEYHDTGMLFVAKAGMMAEALLTRLFQQSMAGAIAAPLTVEVAKQLTDIGRLKPQPLNTQPGQSGSAFQINIQVNGHDVVHSAPMLVKAPGPDPGGDVSPLRGAGESSGTAVPAVPAVLSMSFPSPKGVPPASISNLRTPDFDVRHPLAARSSLSGAVPGPSLTGPTTMPAASAPGGPGLPTTTTSR